MDVKSRFIAIFRSGYIHHALNTSLGFYFEIRYRSGMACAALLAGSWRRAMVCISKGRGEGVGHLLNNSKWLRSRDVMIFGRPKFRRQKVSTSNVLDVKSFDIKKI